MTGYMYLNGFGVEKNAEESDKWYQKSAEQRRADEKASGVDTKAKRFFEELLQKAIGERDAEAQLGLGILYSTGVGVEKNDATAVEWLRLSAEQGNARAQSKLGKCYADGVGVM